MDCLWRAQDLTHHPKRLPPRGPPTNQARSVPGINYVEQRLLNEAVTGARYIDHQGQRHEFRRRGLLQEEKEGRLAKLSSQAEPKSLVDFEGSRSFSGFTLGFHWMFMWFFVWGDGFWRFSSGFIGFFAKFFWGDFLFRVFLCFWVFLGFLQTLRVMCLIPSAFLISAFSETIAPILQVDHRETALYLPHSH